jgi:hypothetical protein
MVHGTHLYIVTTCIGIASRDNYLKLLLNTLFIEVNRAGTHELALTLRMLNEFALGDEEALDITTVTRDRAKPASQLTTLLLVLAQLERFNIGDVPKSA